MERRPMAPLLKVFRFSILHTFVALFAYTIDTFEKRIVHKNDFYYQKGLV